LRAQGQVPGGLWSERAVVEGVQGVPVLEVAARWTGVDAVLGAAGDEQGGTAFVVVLLVKMHTCSAFAAGMMID